MALSLRKRLAREARKLAMECVEGTAPAFGVSCLFTRGEPNCAIVARSGIAHGNNNAYPTNIFDWSLTLSRAETVVIQANDLGVADRADRQSRLVFPLLALADALEEEPTP